MMEYLRMPDIGHSCFARFACLDRRACRVTARKLLPVCLIALWTLGPLGAIAIRFPSAGPVVSVHAQEANREPNQGSNQGPDQGSNRNLNLEIFWQDIFETRKAEKPRPDSSEYPVPPPVLSFGHRYRDDYAIDPAERPQERNPALPANLEERGIWESYRKGQKKLDEKMARQEKRRFNDEFRLGFVLDTYLGVPNLLKIGNLTSSVNIPTPYLFDQQITDATPASKNVPIANNYYEFSVVLHMAQFFELGLGLGYQSDAFLNRLSTIGDSKEYLDGNISRQALYAVRYQKDILFFGLGVAFLLPWVLETKSKTVLGLRVSGSLAMGIVTQEVLDLVRPSLPSSVTPLNTDPDPAYARISGITINNDNLNFKITASVGAYFEIVGFRLYVGYSLRYFPERLYPDSTYYVLQDFGSGGNVSYSSIGFPEIQTIHSVNISIQYWLNPLELLGKRSVYLKEQKKRRRPARPLSHRIG
ncbi:hypothetical protein P0082_09230 [Candidatus Haliotispira prima]|uniref:Outer membrane protein beta-barrel domain-containing protein n=1 Tax=Candidatus Haliotispira prima TaxID=3034016 RepID=A0ABY8MFH1_9SPIO|nr:hypothetical protein P0082_09230 [Candidatus Haliotispira prima]